MRPRELPAEDGGQPDSRRGQLAGFNEAAGVTRGRPTTGGRDGGVHSSFNEAAGVTRGRRVSQALAATGAPAASMRPRELPAEDDILFGDERAAPLRLQ